MNSLTNGLIDQLHRQQNRHLTARDEHFTVQATRDAPQRHRRSRIGTWLDDSARCKTLLLTNASGTSPCWLGSRRRLEPEKAPRGLEPAGTLPELAFDCVIPDATAAELVARLYG